MKLFFRSLLLALLTLSQAVQADSPYIWNGLWAKNLTQKGDLLSNGQPVHYEGNRNYIGNPSGINGLTTGWGVSGAVTVTSTATNTPSPNQIGYALAFAAGSATDFARYRFTVDQVDYGKIFLIQLDLAPQSYTSGDFKLDIFCTSDSTYATGLTRQSLSTDNASNVTAIPNLTGTFKSSFSTASAVPYCEERITRVAGTDTLNVSSDFVGFGPVVQGAALSEEIAYTPTLNAAWGTSPTIQECVYRRIGSAILIRGTINLGSSPTSSALTISFPNGWTTNNTQPEPYGRATTGGGTANYDVIAGALSSTFGFGSSLNLSLPSLTGTALSSVTGPIYFQAIFPIATLVGAGTVNVVQNDVEYAYNSGSVTSAGGSDTTSFGYGPNGTPINAINSTTVTGASTTQFTVQFQTAIQATDQLVLEIGSSAVGWTPNSSFPYVVQGAAAYGARVLTSNSTQAIVAFGNGGLWPSGTTYATAGTAWSGVGANWRIRKIKAGQAVGFSQVSSTAAGLMPANNSSLDNPTATRLGYMQYLSSGTYNGGISPSLSCAQAGFTTVRGVFVPYQMQDGTWRLRFNLTATITSASVTILNITVNGVTFKNVSNLNQSISGLFYGTPGGQTSSYANPGNGLLTYAAQASGAITGIGLSGDVELDSKPTWAY